MLSTPGGTGALTADGRPAADARELARIPARALTSEAIVFQRESRAPARRRAAPAPGAPVEPVDALPVRGQDPGAVLQALARPPDLCSRHAVYAQYDSNVQSGHGRRNEPWRRGHPGQGHDQGAGRHDGRNASVGASTRGRAPRSRSRSARSTSR